MTDTLAVIGFFLTLVSLVGSFFYIHLGDWYRQVQSLKVKWEINKYGDEPDQKSARRHCRYEIEQVANWTMLVNSLVVSGFVLMVALFGFLLWIQYPEKSVAWLYTDIAGGIFLFVFLGLSVFFVAVGTLAARNLRKEIIKSFSSV